MTAFGVRVERLQCPIGTCPWTHDRETPPAETHTFPDGQSPLHEAPTRVAVHFYETWVLPNGVTMSPRPPRLHHAKHERWSHDLWPPAQEWTHPGSHTHIVRPTTEPLVCVLETYGLDQRATWSAHLDEEERLKRLAQADA